MTDELQRGAPNELDAKYVAHGDEDGTELQREIRTFFALAPITVRLTLNPEPGRRQKIVALNGAVTVDGNGHTVAPPFVVPHDHAIEYEFSSDLGRWIPECCGDSGATGATGPQGQTGPGGGQGATGATGAAGVAGCVLLWGNDVLALASPLELSPGYSGTVAIGVEVPIAIPFDGIVDRMYVRHNVPNGNGNGITYRLRRNGANATLNVTLASNAATAPDLINSEPVVQGDILNVRVTGADLVGTPPGGVVVTMRLRPT